MIAWAILSAHPIEENHHHTKKEQTKGTEILDYRPSNSAVGLENFRVLVQNFLGRDHQTSRLLVERVDVAQDPCDI